MTTTTDTRRIVIDPVTRIEGHAKITLHLGEDGRVSDAQFHVTQFRGFEKFTEGRPFTALASLRAATNHLILAFHWQHHELPRSQNRTESRLRELCERLKHDSISQVARDMGIARTTLNAWLSKLRSRFEECGLRDYLERPSSVR